MNSKPRRRLERQLTDAVRSPKPRVPEAGRLLWTWFTALSEARCYGPYGPNPIGFAEIDAFVRLRRIPIESHHVDILRAMDVAWMEEWARRITGNGQPPASARHAVTPTAFDAVFS